MNGVFSPEQREVYNMVLETQIRVIDRVYPGVTLQDLQKYAIRSICDHLRQFGYLNASLVICQDESLFYYFYPHGVSHFIGIDVHDRSNPNDNVSS